MRLWTALVLGSVVFAGGAEAEPREPAAGTRIAAARRGQARPKPAPEKKPEETKSDDTAPIRRGERIEFDARLVQGQTARAGALYLFDRRPSDLRSMVKERESFRDEVVREIFPESGSDL